MDEFFPSEIARLILGYLKEVGCIQSWKTFLEESSNLQEYFLLYKKGKVYPTNVDGKSLFDILNEYRILQKNCKIETNLPKTECNSSELGFSAGMKVMLQEIIRSAVDITFQKYLPLFQGNRDFSSSSGDSALNMHSSSSGTDIHNACEVELMNCLNINKEAKNEDNSDLSTELNIETKNSDHSDLHPNICDVFSLSAKPPNISDSAKSESFNDSSKDKICNIPEVIIVEDEDSNLQVNDSATNIESKNNSNAVDVDTNMMSSTDSTNDSVIVKSCGLNWNTTSSLNMSAKNLSVTEFPISDIQENHSKKAESVQSNVKVELKKSSILETDKTNSNVDFENISVTANGPLVTDLTPQLSDSSCIEISKVSPSSFQNTVEQTNLNCSNNKLGFALSTNNPLATVSDFSPPTYILPGYTTGGLFMQNASPYGIVMSSPFPGMPSTFNQMSLAIPGVSVNNVLNPMFATNTAVQTNKKTDSLDEFTTQPSDKTIGLVEKGSKRKQSQEETASKKKMKHDKPKGSAPKNSKRGKPVKTYSKSDSLKINATVEEEGSSPDCQLLKTDTTFDSSKKA